MLTPVTLSGNYLATAGRRFIPIGVNWVPARAAMQWPYEWDPASIEADFSQMQDLGLNLVRFDLVWQWFEPRPGQYNEEAFRQFDFFVEMAHRYSVYLNPNFFIGGQVGDAYWDVPWRNGRHPHADPDMLRLQAHHAKEFARRYAGENAILAWDLTDEPPFWIVDDSTTDAMAANWTQVLCAGLRAFDPDHLIICGTSEQEVRRGPFRADVIAPWVDLFSVHPYPIYCPDLYPEPLLSTRCTYSAAFETMLSRGAGKSVLMQEFGATSAQFDPERQARYYNTLMVSALAAGNQGFVAWCFTDADPEVQYHRAPYKRNPHETQFGITDHERNELPHGHEMRRMSQVLRQLDLEGVEPAPLEAAVIVPHEWAHGPDYAQYGFPPDRLYQYAPKNILDYQTDRRGQQVLMQSWLSSFVLCRQAGIHVGFPRECDDWSDVPLILAPMPASDMDGYHLYTTFWERVRPLVQAGATLYASLSATSAIPMSSAIELFGAHIADRALRRPVVRLTFIQDFFGIRAGETFEFSAGPGLQGTGAMLDVRDAQVLARDQDDKPALTVHECGQGHAVLCAYPIEFMLGVTPNAFEEGASCWRLYRALKRLAGIQSPFSVDRPEVEVGCLGGVGRACPEPVEGARPEPAEGACPEQGRRDYVILVNHAPDTVQGEVVAACGDGNVMHILPEGAEPVDRAGDTWSFELPGFTGTLFEWRRA